MDTLQHLAIEDFQPPVNELGWGLRGQTEDAIKKIEATAFEAATSKSPQVFQQRPVGEIDPVMKEKWDKFQADKGYEEGSADLSLVDEFVHGRRFEWLPQKTGSCTLSNAFRCWTRRGEWQRLCLGQLEEPHGHKAYGPDTVAFYVPLSYGIARELGGIRNGDGGFCSTTIDSLTRGVLDCNNTKLLELLRKLNANGETDFPEPQDNRVYRTFQSWTYNKFFADELESPLVESVKVTNALQLLEILRQYKPVLNCSMLAVKKGGEHFGLTYFVADRNNSWAHAMCWCGVIVWHGRVFLLLSNESWPGAPIYAIPFEEVDEMIFPRYRPDALSMGEIDQKDAVIAA